MRLGLSLLLALRLCSTVFANPKDGRPDNDDPDDDKDDGSSSSVVPTPAGTTPTATPTGSSPASSTNSSSNPLIGMHGDVVCTDLMCVGGLVNGSTIQYTLQSLGSASVGWMAMGFGNQMANTPMVIMWPNSDGSITLSQRKASGEVMPTVDPNPPRTATPEPSLSILSGNNPKLVFSIPTPSTPSSNIIWAFGSTAPGDSAVDAMLVQHLNSGPTTLDLTKTIAATSKDPTNPVFQLATTGGAGSSTTNNGSDSGTTTTTPTFHLPPLLPYQKYIVAHAIMCVIGFLGLLPLGAIVARWLRTFSPVWFRLHWIIQFALALPIIVTGVALGITAVHKNGTPHLNDTHQKWGVAIFVLYFFQISLGAVIHFFKVPSLARKGIRAPQNYFHAAVGILIIGVSFYQVRTGFRTEWPLTTGRGSVGNGANIVWIIWLVLIPVFYFGGAILLRRQYRQEREAANQDLHSTYNQSGVNMSTRNGGEYPTQ